jgi:hypothetical protein
MNDNGVGKSSLFKMDVSKSKFIILRKYNFIREEYALRLGLSTDRQQKIYATIGSGKTVSTAGTTTTAFQFRDDVQPFLSSFIFAKLHA